MISISRCSVINNKLLNLIGKTTEQILEYLKEAVKSKIHLYTSETNALKFSHKS